ncbi:MAG: efflux RND transporter permease subunit [Candidatus Paceibacterota bacterium]
MPKTPTNHEHSSDSKYLDRLVFKPELRKTWLNYFVTNFRVVILLIVMVSVWGLYSFFTLPRESSPEIKIPIAIVTTLYPGASPTDVEEFVTRKIETELSGLRGLNKLTSNSFNSISSITVEFDAKADINDSIRLLRDKVSDAKNKISTQAEDPVVTEISLDDMPIWSIAITGPYDGFTLRKYAEDIKTELEKISGVREIQISGGDERQYEIAYRPDLLTFYGVSVAEANQAVLAANAAIPAGNFESGSFVVPIRSDAPLDTIADIANVPVTHTEDGGTVFLRDIAHVSERALKKTTYSRLSIAGSAPKNSITLSMVKRQGASILDTVDEAKATVERTIASFPPGITYDIGTDMAKEVRKDFDQLSHDFLLTVLFVFLILFLIVGLKEALVAGLAIPLVFFVTFGMLSALGITLNFLSLFSLILSLGLLVDDAIVVVSATKQYINTGKFTPEEAVLLVLNDFKYVLLTTTLATVWAFLPLLFATGIIGQYMRSIPITVSITLIASLLIALMINHPLAAVLERIRLTRKFFFIVEFLLAGLAAILFYTGGWISISLGIIVLLIEVYLIYWYEKRGKPVLEANRQKMDAEWESDDLIKEKLRQQGSREHENFAGRLIHGIVDFHRFLPVYERAFRTYILDQKKRRWVLGSVVALFIFSVALVPLGFVKSVFFPIQDSDYVFVDMRAPVGTNLTETDTRVKAVEERLLVYPEIANMTTIIGTASANSGNFSGGSSATNLASISMTLKDKSERSMAAYTLADKIRADLSDISGLELNVSTLAGGPPAGAAFQAQVSGDDLDRLSGIVHDLKPILSSIPGVINVNVSQKDSVPEYTFTLDPVAMERNYLNAATVGSVLRTAVSGTELTKIVVGEKEIKLIATFAADSIPNLYAIQNLQILNARKEPVYLKDVAKIELKPAVDVITRIDQKHTIVLASGVDSTTNGQAVLASFEEKLKSYNLPSGYSISYGGENEQNAESVASVLRAMIIALVLIVATLIIQFNSFRKALIVLVPIPLALIGVFIGMAIFDVPLSFPGLIGILALFGIVVKNAIILVDKINLNIESGILFQDAVADAGKSRLEAIFITSICTIVGILPVTLSNELWRSLGGAVIFGLSLSSFLTLFIVPAFFLVMIKDKKKHF